MDNQRRRREILVFSILVSSSTDVLEGSKFKSLYNVVFRHINMLDRKYTEAVPNANERRKETAFVTMLVKRIIPTSWELSSDPWKLWFTLQLMYRMIGSGWRVPRDPELAQFVQDLYTVAQSYNLELPPSKYWVSTVAQAPELLRKEGLFR